MKIPKRNIINDSDIIPRGRNNSTDIFKLIQSFPQTSRRVVSFGSEDFQRMDMKPEEMTTGAPTKHTTAQTRTNKDSKFEQTVFEPSNKTNFDNISLILLNDQNKIPRAYLKKNDVKVITLPSATRNHRKLIAFKSSPHDNILIQ